VIGVIPWPYEFSLQFHEVSRIFILPLSWLADPANWEVRKRSVAFPNRNDPVNLEVFFYKSYTREVLWGVSAEIVQALIDRLGLNNNSG
jgi:hypothetical protein